MWCGPNQRCSWVLSVGGAAACPLAPGRVRHPRGTRQAGVGSRPITRVTRGRGRRAAGAWALAMQSPTWNLAAAASPSASPRAALQRLADQQRQRHIVVKLGLSDLDRRPRLVRVVASGRQRLRASQCSRVRAASSPARDDATAVGRPRFVRSVPAGRRDLVRGLTQRDPVPHVGGGRYRARVHHARYTRRLPTCCGSHGPWRSGPTWNLGAASPSASRRAALQRLADQQRQRHIVVKLGLGDLDRRPRFVRLVASGRQRRARVAEQLRQRLVASTG